MPSETQLIEGINSIITEVGRIAPTLGIARATDRLSLKLSDQITEDEYCQLSYSSHVVKTTEVLKRSTYPSNPDLQLRFDKKIQPVGAAHSNGKPLFLWEGFT